MNGLKELDEVIEYMNTNYPRPNMVPLVRSEPYSLENDWPSIYPNADSPGVYVFFDHSMNLLYIGKASCGADIGSRLDKYIEYGPDNKYKFKQDKVKYSATRFLATISVPDYRSFEAPAVEEFLIKRLKPPLNEQCG